MVALQNPKQFSGRLSFISLFISARGDEYTEKKGRDREEESETDISCYWEYVPLTRSYSSLSFFAFCNVYCRVECNFLTLKIWDWGTRRPFGDRRGAEVDALGGWMMRNRMRERARMRRKEKDRKGERERQKKNRGLKGRITSGILVFAFHLDGKPISRFSVFPATRTATRIRCPLYEKNERRIGPIPSLSLSLSTSLLRLRDIAY